MDEKQEPVVIKEKLLKIRAQSNYHNGLIPDGFGKNWRAGQIREVPLSIFKQLSQDHPTNWDEVK